MAYVCYICGKGKQFGHHVSFSQRKTQKIFKPNIHKQYLTLGGRRLKVKICPNCLRVLLKHKQDVKTVESKKVKLKNNQSADSD